MAAVAAWHNPVMGGFAVPRAAWSRRFAAALPWLGVVAIPTSPALAETRSAQLGVDRPAPPLKTIQSRKFGCAMDVPSTLFTVRDKTEIKAIFCQGFDPSNLSSIVTFRAAALPVSDIFLGERYLAPEAAAGANAWSDIFVPPVTPERFANWVMLHDTRDMIMARNVLSVNGTILMGEQDDPAALGLKTVNFKDLQIVESNSPGVEEAEMSWRCDVVTRGALDDGTSGTETQLVRLLLQNGKLYLASAAVPQANFDSSYQGPFNADYLKKVLNSLRISPYVA